MNHGIPRQFPLGVLCDNMSLFRLEQLRKQFPGGLVLREAAEEQLKQLVNHGMLLSKKGEIPSDISPKTLNL